MIPLTALWLPILLSAVIVFFASFIMHMVPIWNGRSWLVTLRHLLDSVIYAALTAGTFGLLWPKSV